MFPSPDILNEYEHGKFVLSNLAAKRANQLREGAPPLVQIDSTHPLTIALAEIAAGKIKAIMPTDMPRPIEDDHAAVLLDDVPGELGLLLPALDDVESSLVAGLDEEEVEVEADAELDDDLGLASLLDEEEEAAPAAVSDEDETLSLSDIAEQESSDEEETEE